MNIDLEEFRIWFTTKYSNIDPYMRFDQKEEWFVSYEMLLAFMENNLKEFNNRVVI